MCCIQTSDSALSSSASVLRSSAISSPIVASLTTFVSASRHTLGLNSQQTAEARGQQLTLIDDQNKANEQALPSWNRSLTSMLSRSRPRSSPSTSNISSEKKTTFLGLQGPVSRDSSTKHHTSRKPCQTRSSRSASGLPLMSLVSLHPHLEHSSTSRC